MCAFAEKDKRAYSCDGIVLLDGWSPVSIIWGTKEGPWKITQTSWNQGMDHEGWDNWTWTHSTHTGVSFENPSDTREDLFSFGGGKSNRNFGI